MQSNDLATQLVGAAYCVFAYGWPFLAEAVSASFDHIACAFEVEFAAYVVADVCGKEELEAFFSQIGVCELEAIRISGMYC